MAQFRDIKNPMVKGNWKMAKHVSNDQLAFLRALASQDSIAFPYQAGGTAGHGTGAAMVEVPGQGNKKFLHRTPQALGKRGYIVEIIPTESQAESVEAPRPADGYVPATVESFAGEFGPSKVPEEMGNRWARAYRITEAGKKAIRVALGQDTPESAAKPGRPSEAKNAAQTATKAKSASRKGKGKKADTTANTGV